MSETPVAPRMSDSDVRGARISLVVRALVALVLGVLVLVWPRATLSVLAVLFGLYFVISGLVRIARGIFSRTLSGRARALAIVLGVLGVFVGALVVVDVARTVLFLGVVLGIAWIVEGIAAIIESTRGAPRWPGILFGVVGIVGGIVVLVRPTQSLALLAVIGGVLLIVAGVVELVQAFTYGHARRSRQLT